METFAEYVKKSGLSLSAFGADKNNARSFWNWGYVKNFPKLPITQESLMNTCDMRLPLSLTKEHLNYFAEVVLGAIKKI